MKILLIDNGMGFDLNTPYVEPLGGSETSILLLSKGLKELGHQVVLLNNNQQNRIHDENRILDNINFYNDYAELSDVIILNRWIPENILDLIHKKPVYYYSHDAYDQQNVQWLLQPKVESVFEKIFCVSQWQKNTFVNYFNCEESKFEVIGNPIDTSLYSGYAERNENKLIFASIPYKGIEVLPDLFNDICIKSKKDLQLDVFSSFKLYGRDEDEQYSEYFRKLHNLKGVNLHNPISMKGLAYEFLTSSLLIHPITYAETFGRVFVESIMGGCLPVTVNNGANKEVIGDSGYVLDYPNIENIKCYQAFVELTCELLDKDLYGERIKSKEKMKKWNYINIARKVESYLGV